jgi:NAD(P)-dependent dehydrogenase (short-subunit alcohol dehydrogenase family)
LILNVALFGRHGTDPLPIETDVTNEASVAAAIEETVEEFGGLDCLVNNAGIAGPTSPIEEIDVDEWRRVQDVNVLGTFLCAKHAAPHLRESDRGSMVTISSTSAKRSHPLRTPYTASKASQITRTRAIAYDLGEDGVTANTICPGPVDGDRVRRVWEERAERNGTTAQEVRRETEATLPIGEIVDPRDIGEMVAYLAGPNGRHITAQDITIDSGFTVC